MTTNVNGTVSPTTAEILQGAGKLKYDGIDLGSFRDGITVTVNDEFAFTRSDYSVSEIDAERTLTTCEVNTILEQGTIRNMCVVLGGNTSSSSSSSSSIRWDFGPETAVETHELICHGMSEKTKTKARRVTFFRVIRIGSSAIPFRRGAETLLPVTWKALSDSDNDDKFFRVEDPIPLASV